MTAALAKHWGLTTPSAEYSLDMLRVFAIYQHHIRVYYRGRTYVGSVLTEHDIFLSKDVSQIQEQIDVICTTHRLVR
tara:strand:- start:3563 stop:3793 length:231 start_codon:yes stop_codon:yes gene_type:complete